MSLMMIPVVGLEYKNKMIQIIPRENDMIWRVVNCSLKIKMEVIVMPIMEHIVQIKFTVAIELFCIHHKNNNNCELYNIIIGMIQ